MFTGTQSVIQNRSIDIKNPNANKQKDGSSEEFKLNYFKQITTPNKTYNKQAIRNLNGNTIKQEAERARNSHFGNSKSDDENDEATEVEEEQEVEAP